MVAKEKKKMAKGDLTIELSPRDVAVVNKWLSELEKADQGTSIQRALKQASLVIQNAGKSNLATRNKVKTGNLKKSFSIKVVKKKAYALSGFKRPKGAHAHLVDKGTAKRYYQGHSRGEVKGSKFWTDAVQTNGGKAMQTLIDAIYKSIAEITRRNSN